MKRYDIQFGERRTTSGLTLLAVRNPGVATFAAGVVLDVDLRNEAPGEYGLANLVGDCLDEGTQKRSAVELSEAIEDLGGSLDGSASGGSMLCPAEVSQKALRLLAEMATEPAFTARDVKRVQDETLTEMRAEEEEPRTVAGLRFRKEVYGEHPFARPVKGYRESVVGFKPADLRRFHRTWFVPARGYAAAAGPGDLDDTLDLLEKAFRPLRGAPAARPEVPDVTLPQAARDVHLPMKREQVHVYVGHPGVRRTHPDFYALSVMDHILGSGPGFTSRLARRLRDEMGLCYSVHASITSTAGEEPGCFTAYIGTSPEHRRKAIDTFLEEMHRIRDKLPTERELRDVQEYLTGSFVFALERNSNLVSYAVRAKRFELGFEHIYQYPDLIRGVTREDVRRVARDWLHPERVVVVSAGG